MNVRESQHNFQFNICYAPLVCFAVNRFSSLQDSGRLGETVSLCSSCPQSPAFFQVPGHVYRPVWVACKCTGSELRAAGPAGWGPLLQARTLWPARTLCFGPAARDARHLAQSQRAVGWQGGRLAPGSALFLSPCWDPYGLCHLRPEPQGGLHFCACSWPFTVITGLILRAPRKRIMLSSADPSFSRA